MALPSTGVWEVRTTGSDNNGGGWNNRTPGTSVDYTQQDSAQLTLSDLAAVSTSTNLTSATGGFTAAMVGSFIQIVSGTNAAVGFYEITVFTNTGSVTLDRTPTSGGAMSAATGSVGGALASPGKAASAAASSNDVWIQSGTYAITSTTNNVSGGRVTTNGVVNADPARWIGYQTTRGDGGTRPLIQASGTVTSITLVVVSGGTHWINIDVDGASKTGVSGISAGTCVVKDCKVSNCPNSGIFGSGVWLGVEATGITGGTAALLCSGVAWDCTAHGNSVPGIALNTNGVAIRCLSWGNTGASGQGFFFNQNGTLALDCTAYGNAQSGFRGNGQTQTLINCLAVGNSTNGYSTTTTPDGMWARNCAAYNNTSGDVATGTFVQNDGFITLTADPFVNAASQNFALNTTTGGGAALRAAGLPSSWPGASTTSYPDIGAVQHADAGSGTGAAGWIGLFG